LAAGQHEQVVEEASQLLATHGSKMSKEQMGKMVEQQRSSILQCVLQVWKKSWQIYVL